MTKKLWLVEWTREELPHDNLPSPQFEESVMVDTLAADITWILFEAEFDVVDSMVDRTDGGWKISEAPDGEYVDLAGAAATIKDGELIDAHD